MPQTKQPQVIPPDADSVKFLIIGAARYKLLTHEQECRYGQQVQAAIAVAQEIIVSTPQLKKLEGFFNFPNGGVSRPMSFKTSAKECLRFANSEQRRALTLGSRAIDKFVQSNLRLAMTVAKNYIRAVEGRGSMSYEDLCQEGFAGLIRAAEKFQPSRGYRFSTYAYSWIRQAITRAISNNSLSVRLPIHIHEDLVRLRRAESRFAGRRYDPAEIAHELWPEKSPEKAIAKYWELKLLNSARPISFEVPVGDKTVLGDMLPSEEDLEAQVESEFLADQVQEVLAGLKLSDRDMAIVKERIMAPKAKSLTALGNETGLSRERVRQVQNGLTRRLRNSPLKALASGLP